MHTVGNKTRQEHVEAGPTMSMFTPNICFHLLPCCKGSLLFLIPGIAIQLFYVSIHKSKWGKLSQTYRLWYFILSYVMSFSTLTSMKPVPIFTGIMLHRNNN